MRLGVKPISLVIFGANEPAVLNRKVPHQFGAPTESLASWRGR